jgi:CII-binding regulator of phage lambda lysogenization HflD
LLWWQTGGRRRQILFNRTRYVEQAKTLLRLAD